MEQFLDTPMDQSPGSGGNIPIDVMGPGNTPMMEPQAMPMQPVVDPMMEAPMGPAPMIDPMTNMPVQLPVPMVFPDKYATRPGQELLSGVSPVLDSIANQPKENQSSPQENNVLDYFEYVKNNPHESIDKLNANVYSSVHSNGMQLFMPTEEEVVEGYRKQYAATGQQFDVPTEENLRALYQEISRAYERYSTYEFSTNRSSSPVIPNSFFNKNSGFRVSAKYDDLSEKLKKAGLQWRALGKDKDGMGVREAGLAGDGMADNPSSLFQKNVMDEWAAKDNYEKSGKVGVLDGETGELKLDENGQVIYKDYEKGFFDDWKNFLTARTYRRDPNTGAVVLVPLDDKILDKEKIDLRKVNNLMSSWSQPTFETQPWKTHNFGGHLLNPLGLTSAGVHLGAGILGDMMKTVAGTVDLVTGAALDNKGTSHANAFSRALYGASTALRGSTNLDQRQGAFDNLASFGYNVGQVIQSFLPVVMTSGMTAAVLNKGLTKAVGANLASQISAKAGASMGLGYGAAMAGESAYQEALSSNLFTEREASAFAGLNAAAVYMSSSILQGKWLEGLAKGLPDSQRSKLFSSIQKGIIEDMKKRGVPMGTANTAKELNKAFAKYPMSSSVQKYLQPFSQFKGKVLEYWNKADKHWLSQSLINSEGVEESVEDIISSVGKAAMRDYMVDNSMYKQAREFLGTDLDGFLADNKRDKEMVEQMKAGNSSFSERTWEEIAHDLFQTFAVSQVGGALTSVVPNYMNRAKDYKEDQLHSNIAQAVLDGTSVAQFTAMGDELRVKGALGNSRLDMFTGKPAMEFDKTEAGIVYKTTIDLFKKYHALADRVGLVSEFSQIPEGHPAKEKAVELLSSWGNKDKVDLDALQAIFKGQEAADKLGNLFNTSSEESVINQALLSDLGISAQAIKQVEQAKKEQESKADGSNPVEEMIDFMTSQSEDQVDSLLQTSKWKDLYNAEKDLIIISDALERIDPSDDESIDMRLRLEEKRVALLETREKNKGLLADIVADSQKEPYADEELTKEEKANKHLADILLAKLEQIRGEVARKQVANGTIFKNSVQEGFILKELEQLQTQLDAVSNTASADSMYAVEIAAQLKALKEEFFTPDSVEKDSVSEDIRELYDNDLETIRKEFGRTINTSKFRKSLLDTKQAYYVLQQSQNEQWDTALEEAKDFKKTFFAMLDAASIESEADIFEFIKGLPIPNELAVTEENDTISYVKDHLLRKKREVAGEDVKLPELKDVFESDKVKVYGGSELDNVSMELETGHMTTPIELYPQENREQVESMRNMPLNSASQWFHQLDLEKYTPEQQKALQDKLYERISDTTKLSYNDMFGNEDSVFNTALDYAVAKAQEVGDAKFSQALDEVLIPLREVSKTEEDIKNIPSDLISKVYSGEISLDGTDSLKERVSNLVEEFTYDPEDPASVKALKNKIGSLKGEVDAATLEVQKKRMDLEFQTKISKDLKDVLDNYTLGAADAEIWGIPGNVYEQVIYENDSLKEDLNNIHLLISQFNVDKYTRDNDKAYDTVREEAEMLLNLSSVIQPDEPSPEWNQITQQLKDLSSIEGEEDVEQVKQVIKEFHVLKDALRAQILDKPINTLEDLPDNVRELLRTSVADGRFSMELEGINYPKVRNALVSLLGMSSGQFYAIYKRYYEKQLNDEEHTPSLEQMNVLKEMVSADVFSRTNYLTEYVKDPKIENLRATIEDPNTPPAMVQENIKVLEQYAPTTLDEAIFLNAPAASGKTRFLAAAYLNIMSDVLGMKDNMKVVTTAPNSVQTALLEKELAKHPFDVEVLHAADRQAHIEELVYKLNTADMGEPDYLVIDEITLMPETTIKKLAKAIKNYNTKSTKPLRVLFLGDPYQLTVDADLNLADDGSFAFGQGRTYSGSVYYNTVSVPTQTYRYSVTPVATLQESLEKAIDVSQAELLPKYVPLQELDSGNLGNQLSYTISEDGVEKKGVRLGTANEVLSEAINHYQALEAKGKGDQLVLIYDDETAERIPAALRKVALHLKDVQGSEFEYVYSMVSPGNSVPITYRKERVATSRAKDFVFHALVGGNDPSYSNNLKKSILSYKDPLTDEIIERNKFKFDLVDSLVGEEPPLGILSAEEEPNTPPTPVEKEEDYDIVEDAVVPQVDLLADLIEPETFPRPGGLKALVGRVDIGGREVEITAIGKDSEDFDWNQDATIQSAYSMKTYQGYTDFYSALQEHENVAKDRIVETEDDAYVVTGIRTDANNSKYFGIEHHEKKC